MSNTGNTATNGENVCNANLEQEYDPHLLNSVSSGRLIVSSSQSGLLCPHAHGTRR